MIEQQSSTTLRQLQNDRPTCHGYVCLYSCISEFQPFINTDTNPIQTMILPYRYEIYSNVNTTDLSSELKQIESYMLDELSNESSLDNCSFLPSSSSSASVSSFHQLSFDYDDEYDWIYPNVTLDNDDLIVSLASSPLDKVNEENGKIDCRLYQDWSMHIHIYSSY